MLKNDRKKALKILKKKKKLSKQFKNAKSDTNLRFLFLLSNRYTSQKRKKSLEEK